MGVQAQGFPLSTYATSRSLSCMITHRLRMQF